MAKNALRKKLLRDMRRSFMQFLSIVVLCSLGTFMFAGLNGTARLAQGTINAYFEQNNLADFWVAVPSADRDTLERISSLEGVADVCARATADLESTLPGNPTLNVTAYNGPMRINQPLVSEGTALSETDLRGCLIQAGFASVHDLSVGDRINVKLAGQEYGFVIRGIVYSPEFICVTDGVYPNPEVYGYILINAQAMPALPLSQIIVRLEPGADAQAVQKAIETALPTALVINRGAHYSTANANSNAVMFNNLTLVFPLIAYAVAALIVMTTLTRMIDNQRPAARHAQSPWLFRKQNPLALFILRRLARADRLPPGCGFRPYIITENYLGAAAGPERISLSNPIPTFPLLPGAW